MENSEKKRRYFLIGAIISFVIVLLLLAFFSNNPLRRFIVGEGDRAGTGSSTELSLTSTGTETSEGKKGTGWLSFWSSDEEGSSMEDAATGDVGGNGKRKNSLFRQLTTIPVAGSAFIERGGKTVVRYVAAETGFIYDVDPGTGETTQITNTTFEKGVVEATIFGNGSNVIMRYAEYRGMSDTIKTYLGTIDARGTGIGSVKGIFLPDGITSISVSPDGQTIAYVREEGTGIAIVTRNVMSGSEKIIFQNPHKEWIITLLSNGDLLLTTKPSYSVPGYAYVYHPKIGELERLIRNKDGLTTLPSPNGDLVLFSSMTGGSLSLGLHFKKARFFETEEYNEDTFSIATLSDKCAWGASEGYIYCAILTLPGPIKELPDLWYQGVIIPKDRFWALNPNTMDVELLADPFMEIARTFDALSLAGDPADNFVIFTEKSDGFLWSLRIIHKDTVDGAQE